MVKAASVSQDVQQQKYRRNVLIVRVRKGFSEESQMRLYEGIESLQADQESKTTTNQSMLSITMAF